MHIRTVYIIGKGESVQESFKYRPHFRSKYVLAVNHAVEYFGRFTNAVFFKDDRFASDPLLDNFGGLKIASLSRTWKRITGREYGYLLFSRDRDKEYGISVKPCSVAWRMCGGLTAINAAYHLGFNKVVLIGFDGTEDPTKTTELYTRGEEEIARDASSLGLEIVNTSMDSRLRYFKKERLERHL